MLRATLTLRCYAALRTGLTPTLRMPHADNFAIRLSPFMPNLNL
ncbi:MAG: hypothetical protein RML94_15275 [Bacteroidia bacterium]|nr:hypothetical protein [Bacteroidia bacterium]